MTDDCKYVQEKLSAYLDGVLFKQDKDLIKKHLFSCDVCRLRLEELKELSRSVAGLERVKPPVDFLRKVQERIKETDSVDGFLNKFLQKPQVKIPAVVLVSAVLVFIVIKNTGLYSPRRLRESRQSTVTMLGTPLPADKRELELSELPACSKTRIEGLKEITQEAHPLLKDKSYNQYATSTEAEKVNMDLVNKSKGRTSGITPGEKMISVEFSEKKDFLGGLEFADNGKPDTFSIAGDEIRPAEEIPLSEKPIPDVILVEGTRNVIDIEVLAVAESLAQIRIIANQLDVKYSGQCVFSDEAGMVIKLPYQKLAPFIQELEKIAVNGIKMSHNLTSEPPPAVISVTINLHKSVSSNE